MEIIIAFPVILGVLLCGYPSCINEGKGCLDKDTIAGPVFYKEGEYYLFDTKGEFFLTTDMHSRLPLNGTFVITAQTKLFSGGKQATCRWSSRNQLFNKTESYSTLTTRETKEKGCFSDGAHLLPSNGTVQTLFGSSSLDVKWGPRTLSVQRVPDAAKADPLRRRKRSGVWCPSVSGIAGFFGLGAAHCDLSGIEDDLNKRITERYEQAEAKIQATRAEEKQDYKVLQEHAERLTAELGETKDTLVKYNKAFKKFEEDFDTYVEQSKYWLEHTREDLANEVIRAKRAEGYLLAQQIVDAIHWSEDFFYLAIRMHTGTCKYNFPQGRIRMTPMKKISAHITNLRLGTHALTEALHNLSVTSASMNLRTLAFLNGTLSYTQEEGMLINKVGNNSAAVAHTLNKVIKADAEDLAQALDGDSGTYHFIAWLSLGAIQCTVLFLQIRGGANNHRLWDFLWKVSVSVSFLIVGLIQFVSWVTSWSLL